MIGVGDKVVRIENPATAELAEARFTHPGGVPEKGRVYIVGSLYVTKKEGILRLRINGMPCINKRAGEDWGWLARRFRKLEDHRAKQELEYLRKLPQPVLTTD